jgi:hypothetical protein
MSVSHQRRAVEGPSNVVDHPKGFAKVMNDVARSGRLNLQELGLYTLILGYAGPDGECWTDQETLAKYVGCSVRMLQVYLRNLIARGFIFERPRRESQGETKGRAYSASDDWRRMPHDSHATGCARVDQRHKSHPQPARGSPATGCETHPQPVAALKRPVKRPGEKTAVPAVFRGEEGEAGASVAAAAAVVKTITDDDQTTTTTSPQAPPSAPPPGPRSSPPKSSAAPKTVARSVHRKPRTEPPEAIPIPPALLDWATEQGYTPEIIARETERPRLHGAGPRSRQEDRLVTAMDERAPRTLPGLLAEATVGVIFNEAILASAMDEAQAIHPHDLFGATTPESLEQAITSLETRLEGYDLTGKARPKHTVYELAQMRKRLATCQRVARLRAARQSVYPDCFCFGLGGKDPRSRPSAPGPGATWARSSGPASSCWGRTSAANRRSPTTWRWRPSSGGIGRSARSCRTCSAS